uniref:Ig-like domain-containing protein n=1 Tax=Seriola lalandi dorsalis TaxID=1841481 RepID=A0A3B4WRH1_SERLL
LYGGSVTAVGDVTSDLLCSVTLCPSGRLTIVAHREQDVTLPCQTRSRAAIIAAEWSRPDQESHYVFFYRDDQADKTHQHPSFEDRVELADGRMKGGNLSLILRHVRRSDGGTYECRVKQETAARRKRAFISAEPISIVDLRVTESRECFTHFNPQRSKGKFFLNSPLKVSSIKHKTRVFSQVPEQSRLVL